MVGLRVAAITLTWILGVSRVALAADSGPAPTETPPLFFPAAQQQNIVNHSKRQVFAAKARFFLAQEMFEAPAASARATLAIYQHVDAAQPWELQRWRYVLDRRLLSGQDGGVKAAQLKPGETLIFADDLGTGGSYVLRVNLEFSAPISAAVQEELPLLLQAGKHTTVRVMVVLPTPTVAAEAPAVRLPAVRFETFVRPLRPDTDLPQQTKSASSF